MTDEIEREAKWLSFADSFDDVRAAGRQPWLHVRGAFDAANEDRHRSAAFIPSRLVSEVVKEPYWDDRDAGPSVISDGSARNHRYYRTNGSGIEPLVIEQSFSGLRPSTFDLLEEFRLFHNLYFDAAKREYVKLDDAGDAVIVARASADWENVEVLARPVRQFMAWKEVHLALYVEWHRYSTKTLEELGLPEMRGRVNKTPTSSFSFTMAPCDFREGYRSIGRLVGKVLVAPLNREESGWGPYEDERQYQSFIVGVDKDGHDIALSCAPEVSESKFLVPVWFRAEVLKKYQSEPERYDVSDGQVRSQGRWHLAVDNDHKDHVAVFLGDLQMLPEKEQLHWRAHNIVPPARLSETAVRRSLKGEWTSAERPELRFARAYEEFMQFFEKLGFYVIRPLALDDEHCLKTLHVPYTESVMDFDNEIVKLTKLLVDSINVSEVEKHITVEENEPSISKLEKYLKVKGRTDFEQHIALLRDLQRYRSQNASRRRGKDAYKSFAKLAPGVSSRRDVLAAILVKAIALLGYLREVHTTGQTTHNGT